VANCRRRPLPSQPETEDASAVRLAHCLRGLEAINPLFSSWIRCGKRHRSTVPRIVTSPPDEAELRAWICEGTEFESRDGRKHKIGYAIEALTPKDKPVRAHFWVSSEPAPWWLLNRLGLTIFAGTGYAALADPRNSENLTALLRGALLTVATTWKCKWAGVTPGGWPTHEQPYGDPLVQYQSGWMIYLDAARAARIDDPQDIECERLADGAMLLTAVRTEIFDGHNPVHRDASIRIQTALAPLNEAPDGSSDSASLPPA
jgi:hypothetical protein